MSTKLEEMIDNYNLGKLILSFIVSWSIVKFVLSFRPPQRSISPVSGFLLWPVYLRNVALHRSQFAKTWFARIRPLIFSLLICTIPLILLFMLNNISIPVLVGIPVKKFNLFYQKILDFLSKANLEWLMALNETAQFYVLALIYYLFGGIVTFGFFEDYCIHASHPEMLPFLQYSMTLVTCVCAAELNKYSNLSGIHKIAANYFTENVDVVRIILSTLIILQLLYVCIELVPLLLKRVLYIGFPKLRWYSRMLPRRLLTEAEYLEETETATRQQLKAHRQYLLNLTSKEVWHYVLKVANPQRFAKFVLSEEDDDTSHLAEDEMIEYQFNSRPRLPADIERELDDEIVARQLQTQINNDVYDGNRPETAMETDESSTFNTSIFRRFIPAFR